MKNTQRYIDLFVKENLPQRCSMDCYYDQCLDFVKGRNENTVECIFSALLCKTLRPLISDQQYGELLGKVTDYR